MTAEDRQRELLRSVRRIQIRTARLIRDLFAGQYQSAFKGRGIAFSEVREYIPGDDIRSIDWNVTARMNAPYVKQFVEERELTLILAVDVSGSGRFGSGGKSKIDLEAELAAILAISAIQNGDRVGLILFTDRVEKYVPAGKGPSHALRIIRDLLFHEPAGRATRLAAALDFMNRVLRRRAVVFLVSDFQSPDTAAALPVTSRRHDLVAVRVADPFEERWPAIGLVELKDLETGDRLLWDTSSRSAARALREAVEKSQAELEKIFQSIKMDHLAVRTDQSPVDPLRKFFHQRRRRRMR